MLYNNDSPSLLPRFCLVPPCVRDARRLFEISQRLLDSGCGATTLYQRQCGAVIDMQSVVTHFGSAVHSTQHIIVYILQQMTLELNSRLNASGKWSSDESTSSREAHYAVDIAGNFRAVYSDMS